MQLRGLEPLPKYMDMNLNHARMPIPPQLHIQFCFLMIHIRKMQLTGLEPVRARLTRSLVLRVCQFRHNCIFCFCLLSNFVCCFFVFSIAHLTIYIYYHMGNDLSTLFSKKIKKLFVGAFLCLKTKKYSQKATNSLLCGSIRVFSFFCYNLLCQLQANCKTNN